MSVRRDGPPSQGPERAGGSLPGPLGLAAGFVASTAVTMISWIFGAGTDPRIGLVLLTLTAVVVGAMTTVPGAIGAGALCWACYSGFLLDRLGILTFERGGGQALVMMVLCATVASAVAGLVRWGRAVAADHARTQPLSAGPAAATLSFQTRRVQVIRPVVGRSGVDGKHPRWL